ncbi:hypothetical protein Dtox_2600 [Desulfofarcimen acetoxidans DSM 771]|uniref:Alkaline shock response membrane anchor protein AmaP n=1 Tax=Desulfofarcimen acetoxidans (strain ATCC 49208 / DSM 771 / KCTC 5769 / VKM B-1644 / 5575) TaxID=485916 RepID=C8W0Z7_DESAS|nr:alkaline shock response membrane anchor protein AmaP [Desulfofarcimen acetoxidans]ACV63393.1 hypothetical protein Dtox_2600 [Desulfofarcimen acetoxidans DSM 771]
MGSFDRIVLGLYSFLLTIIIILSISFLSGWRYPVDLINLSGINQMQKETVAALLIILILAGIRLFFVSLKYQKAGKHAVVNDNALGEVRISLQAIEGLVEKKVLLMSGVRQAKPKIVAEPPGISLYMEIVVTPDINVPQISGLLQEQIKEYVFEVTGITVNNVKILVESFAVNKPRVE